ncbi:MAG: DUF349 domain-containing protein [Planctomycetota bacterium]
MREAEDWKRWANVDQLEQLCQKMEALREVDDAAKAAREMKLLQREWKAVGPARRDKSEELWTRFKTASDAVYQRCREQFDKLDQERSENLKKKEELCEKVATLVAASAEESAQPIGWKATADQIKALQEEWKQIGPVPKEQADAIWKRFREPCDRFFERWKAHHQQVDQERAQNLKRQEELCEKVEALAGATQWKTTAEQIKALQAEWKTIGPAPRDKADAVWQRFRGACDRFFERRKAYFEKMDAERAENLQKKEALIQKAEQLIDADDDASADELIKGLMAEWKAVGPPPKDQADAVWDRFRRACDQIRDTRR